MKCIYVDLDGTLVKSDLLFESILILLKQRPLTLMLFPFWLLKGKTHFKYEICKRTSIDPGLLPYNEGLLEYLKTQKGVGVQLILATASFKESALKVAEYLGIFDNVLASDQYNNLKGERKLRAIQEQIGDAPFTYVGNDNIDLIIWKSAEKSIIVNANNSVTKKAKEISRSYKIIDPLHFSLLTNIKAIRVYHWLKNSLLFVPLITAHAWYDFNSIYSLVLAFFAFSFAASSGYLFNDLLDLNADRQHPRKQKRPLAAGDIPIPNGIYIMLGLIVFSEILSLAVSFEFFIVLNVYFILTLAYSLELKKRPLVDTTTLASLYTLRVIAGGIVIGVSISFWLLVFSIFIFLSLAFIKRCSELEKYEKKGHSPGLVPGRGYSMEDFLLLKIMGIVSGYLAVVVFALFINSPEIENKYHNPELLWGLLPLLLYWISRMWMHTSRAKMEDDPLIFALRDRGSRWVILLQLILVYLAV